MSELRQASVALILIGLIGILAMALYLRTSALVDLAMLPRHHRGRVVAWRRIAPCVIVSCTSLVLVGSALTAA